MTRLQMSGINGFMLQTSPNTLSSIDQTLSGFQFLTGIGGKYTGLILKYSIVPEGDYPYPDNDGTGFGGLTATFNVYF